MNRKQLTILLVSLVVLGGVVLALYRKDTAAWQTSVSEDDRAVLRDFPLNDVAHVRIQDGEGEVNLIRRGGVWTVRERDHYPADFGEISRFLRTMWELKSVRELEVGPTQFVRFELAEPGQGTGSGTLVEFLDADGGRLDGLVAGKHEMQQAFEPSPFGGDGSHPVGRYLRPLGGSDRVALVSDTLNGIHTDIERWLNKDFIQIQKVRSIAVTPREGPAWKVFRESEAASWQLADIEEGEELERSKVSAFGQGLSRPSFTDVMVDGSGELTGMDEPIVATVGTFDGLVYTLNIGKPSENDYFLRVSVDADFPEPEEGEDEDTTRAAREKLEREQKYADWTYRVSRWTVESLLHDRAALLKVDESSE